MSITTAEMGWYAGGLVEGDFELKYLYCSRLAEDLSPPLFSFFVFPGICY